MSDAAHRAELLLDTGRVEAALEVLASAPPGREVDTVAVRALLEAGRSAPARARAVALVEAAPHDPVALVLLSVAEQACGGDERALEAARAAVEAAPGWWVSHHQVVTVHLQADRRRRSAWREASEHLRRARALAPDEPDVHVLAARLELARERGHAARRAVGRALALDPGHADARDVLTVLDAARGDVPSVVAGVSAMGRRAGAYGDVVRGLVVLGWLRALHLGTFVLLTLTRFTDTDAVHGVVPSSAALGVLAVVALVAGTRWALGGAGRRAPGLLRAAWRRSRLTSAWTVLVLVSVAGTLVRCWSWSPDVRAVGGGVAMMALLLGVLVAVRAGRRLPGD